MLHPCETSPWRTRLQRLGPWLLIPIVLWGLVASFRSTCNQPDPLVHPDRDYGIYYRAGLRVRSGESPYQIDIAGHCGSYAYSPAVAYLFVPFTYAHYNVGRFTWLAGNWFATALLILLAWRLLDHPPERAKWFLLAVALVCVGNYFVHNYRQAQTGIWLAVACLGWAYSLRVGRPWLSGSLLAAACLLKLMPVLLVPWMVLRKEWRGLAAFCLAAIGFALLPALWVGVSETISLHVEWLEHLERTSVPGHVYRQPNQSLLGVLARTAWISNGMFCYSQANMADLMRMYPYLVLALAGTTYVWIWRNRRNGTGPRHENAHLAILFGLMTVVNPRGWVLNYVILVLPTLMILQACWERRPRRQAGVVAMALLVFACAIRLPEPTSAEHSWWIWFLQGRHVWASIVLVAAAGVTSGGVHPRRAWWRRTAGINLAARLRSTIRV